MSDFTDEMNDLNPTVWWRLGESSGTTASEEEKNLHGTYVNSPSLGKSGAIANDSNTSVLFNSTQSECVEVDDDRNFSLVRAHDTFTRSESNGWGTAESGGSWTTEVSAASYFSCNGSHAVIDQTGTTGTWQQGINQPRKFCEVQVRVRWDERADGGTLKPLMLVARRVNANNYYRAQLQEDADHNLDLLIVKVKNGNVTTLATASNIGTYPTANEWWYVRFRLDNNEQNNLKARAWKKGTTQPTTWTVSATDSAISASGTVSIRSSNSGTESRPTVQFDDFWMQTLGMTVHVWMRPWILDFTASNDYIYFLGKGETDKQEWAFRFYNDKTGQLQRDNRVSVYMWSLKDATAPPHLGVGAYFQPDENDPIEEDTWYQFVAVFDPGDKLDQEAGGGVTLFKDGSFVKGPRDGYATSPGTFYRWTEEPVIPGNGTAKLRFATRSGTKFFKGRLDEIAIFDRILSDTEISDLYDAAT